ncbi:MAG: hypothetical protein DMD37_05635 [Gemmatimonadetes bacterium]|nr:MAG: hypothetical protein DMD37_05635 [Gemmatimonadota bacterium]
MLEPQPLLETRITTLERRLRRTQSVAVLAVTGVLALAAAAWVRPFQQTDTIRAKVLILEDAQGRKRMLLGAPIPEPPGARIAPSTGMIILDTTGVERFGVGLFPNGMMNMGFDAPPGTGDDRNRERINLTASPNGGAEIRMLDRKTWVRWRVALDSQDSVTLQFLDFPPGEAVMRRFSISGTDFSRQPRQ